MSTTRPNRTNVTNTTKPVVTTNSTAVSVPNSRTFGSAEGRFALDDSFPAPTGLKVFSSNGLEGRFNSSYSNSSVNKTFSSAEREGLLSSNWINPN